MATNNKPIVLITGANTGIGLTTVKAFCQSNIAYDILLGSRNIDKGHQAAAAIKQEFPDTKSVVTVVEIDITSDESIEDLADLVTSRYGKLDILINNAGAALDLQLEKGSLKSMRHVWTQSWEINVTSTQIMTTVFVPLLLKSSDPRLLFLTSGTACLAETMRSDSPMLQRLNHSPAQGWPKEEQLGMSAYRSVKTGLNMMMREWTRILKNDGVRTWAISPGFLATALGGTSAEGKKSIGAGDPQLGGDFIRDVVEGKRDGDVGKSIRRDEVQEW